MNSFAALFAKLEANSDKKEAVHHLKDYLSSASKADAAWAIYFLSGHRIKKLLNTRDLRRWAQESANIPDWLFEESYSVVGDICETIALLFPADCTADNPQSGAGLEESIGRSMASLGSATKDEQREFVLDAWRKLNDAERLLFNKLFTAGLHSPVSMQIIIAAIAEHAGIEKSAVAQRLQGNWQPSEHFYESLTKSVLTADDTGGPYPFCSMQVLDLDRDRDQLHDLGEARNWLALWHWDGIRAQLLKHGAKVSLWSDNEELLTSKFPELAEEGRILPEGTVLEGYILAWKDADVMPFEILQQRLKRKSIAAKRQADLPVIFMACEMLEENGQDIRRLPLVERRERLAAALSTRSKLSSETEYAQLQLFAPCRLQLSTILRTSPSLEFSAWSELETLRSKARKMKAQGIMLLRKDSSYTAAEVECSRFLCKSEPIIVHAVLVAAQVSSENKNSIFDDYSFAVWDKGELVHFVRISLQDSEAKEGVAVRRHDLAGDEIAAIDSFVRKNTLARFGPVCSVKPDLVFELACDSIHPSSRNKSGLSARASRIVRWARAMNAAEADSVDKIHRTLSR